MTYAMTALMGLCLALIYFIAKAADANEELRSENRMLRMRNDRLESDLAKARENITTLCNSKHVAP